MIHTLSEVNELSETVTGNKATSTVRFLRGTSRLPWCLAALLACVFFALPAHASTFLYAFSTTQLLGALSVSDADYSSDAYYTILLQPTGLAAGYTMPNQYSPKPGGVADDWQATTDSADAFGSGTWIEFAKLDVQTTVTLVSGANGGPGGKNIFYYPGISPLNTYSDAGGSPPVNFGTTVASIDSIMAPGAQFSFTLGNLSSNPGAVTFTGEAMAIESSFSSSVYSGQKGRLDVPFSLTLTGTEVVPEPSTLILFLAGAACLLAAAILKKKRPAASSRS